MKNVNDPKDINELWMMLRERLMKPGYANEYTNESEFEAEVWTRVVNLATQIGLDVGRSCLTSHVERERRSAVAWNKFSNKKPGRM